MSWTVKVKFQDPIQRAKDEPDLAFPNTECNQALGFIARKWDALPEEYEEWGITFSDDSIQLDCDVIDYFADFINFVMSHTVPLRVEFYKEVGDPES